MDPNLVAAGGGVITATVATLVGFFATRSKVKLDDIATLQQHRDEARRALAAEEKARAQDKVDMQAAHDVEIEKLETRIGVLNMKIDERDSTINKLDRLMIGYRKFVSRLSGRLADNNIDLPDRPVELDAD